VSIPVAAIVLAYDLGADPYMVLIRAWTDPTGLWVLGRDGFTLQHNAVYFGESVQGFRGWFFAAFCITYAFRLVERQPPPVPATASSRRQALWPVLLYLGFAVFQSVLGRPPETQSIATVAMGIPVVFALAGWMYYREVTRLAEGKSL
jgi:hypothetical protein